MRNMQAVLKTMKFLMLSGFLVYFWGIFSTESFAATSNSAQITGVILNKSTGVGISAAKVTLIGSKTEYGTNTDTQGKFKMKVRPGTYSVGVTHPKYQTFQTKIKLTAKKTQKVSWSVEPKGPTKGPIDQSAGIWISPAELAGLPTHGPAWENLKKEADKPTDNQDNKPQLSDQDDPINVRVMAKALVYARTGEEKYRNEVIDACMAAMGTEKGGRTLSLGRELIAYVISADLVGLPPEKDQAFRNWLRETLSEELEKKTLVSTHEERPNNWGTHAGASRLAVAVYLKDTAEIERVAQVFKGWLGDRSSYAGFEYGNLDWQADPKNPVGINPKGATKNGHSIDGVLPDDQRRSGGFKSPPPKENYVYEALQGVLAQAVILYRLGYDVWNWEDQAILRAFRWLHEEANFPAGGDDTWQPHIINYYYGTNFPSPVPSNPGKNVGWTDWTHKKG